MMNFEIKPRLKKGGIYSMAVNEVSKEVTDKGTSIKITLGTEDIEQPIFLPIIDDSASSGKKSVFIAQINELVQGFCTNEEKKKKNPLIAKDYNELADNVIKLVNDNKGKVVKIKIIVSTYNGKSKIAFPAFGDWLSTDINGNKPLVQTKYDVFEIPEQVTPSDDLSALMNTDTPESSDIITNDLPF